MTRTGVDGAAAWTHQLGLHEGGEQLVELVAAVVERAQPADAAVVLDVAPATCPSVLRSLEEHHASVHRVRRDPHRPAARIKEYLRAVDELLDAGADRVVLVTDAGSQGAGVRWRPWARFEAYLNCALAPRPVDVLCLYDRRATTERMLVDLLRTHTHVATVEAATPNEIYQDPELVLEGMTTYQLLPVEASPPALALDDPTPTAARAAARQLMEQTDLDAERREGLVGGVSEVVTNAISHGKAPTTVRGWAGREWAMITVTDAGAGPEDPAAGLAPVDRPAGRGGLGLWLAHQLCDEVTMGRHDGTFTVRLGIRVPDEAPAC